MSEEKYVTATQVEPDHSKERKKGSFWCPYCADWSVFTPRKYGEGKGYPRCEGCNISNEDFWVKMSNKTWGFPKGTIKPTKR